MAELSDTARAVAAAWFGLMLPGTTSRLRFGMVQSRPSDTAQAGLDELVTAGVIAREDEPGGAVVYRPLVDCHPHLTWMMERAVSGADMSAINFRMTTPIEGAP